MEEIILITPFRVIIVIVIIFDGCTTDNHNLRKLLNHVLAFVRVDAWCLLDFNSTLFDRF